MTTRATATLHLKLKADSGYTSEESHRITPEQWGDVLRVVTGQTGANRRTGANTMPTRKKLIERIQAMQLGTQEMLDAAAEDARLIPFDTLFVDKGGNVVARGANKLDDKRSVALCSLGGVHGIYRASQLRPVSED